MTPSIMSCVTESMINLWSIQTWVKLKAGRGWLMSSWTHRYLTQMEQRYIYKPQTREANLAALSHRVCDFERKPCVRVLVHCRLTPTTACCRCCSSCQDPPQIQTLLRGPGSRRQVSKTNTQSYAHYACFTFGYFLFVQTKRTTLTGPNTWWRVRTLTQDHTQTPLWVNHFHNHKYPQNWLDRPT